MVHVESQFSTEPAEDDKRTAWRQNAPVLYDLFFDTTLTWPSLAVSWLPDEGDIPCRLAYGTNTNVNGTNEESNSIIIAELNGDVEDNIDFRQAWHVWQFQDKTSTGFGWQPQEGHGSPIQVIARLNHPTEVNRIACCPTRHTVLASKASSGNVLVYNYAEPEEKPLTLSWRPSNEEGVEGFPLQWDPQGDLLASGGNDGRLCIWDVGSSANPSALFDAPNAHDGPLNDLSYSSGHPLTLVSIGEDRRLKIWDARAGSWKSQLVVEVSTDYEPLSVDCNKLKFEQIATAGKGNDIQVFDLRSLQGSNGPLHRLKGGHSGDADVPVVRWAPFKASALATGGSDNQLIIWDLQKEHNSSEDNSAAGEDEDPAELLFKHTGHEGPLADLSWSEVDDWLLCSVSENDNVLQVWQVSTSLYLPDSDDEGDGEPSAKRSRTDT